MSDYKVMEQGKLIKQVLPEPVRPRVFKTGRRKVRIKVGSWLHIALDGLKEAYPDSMNRNNVIPPFAMQFDAKPMEKLLRYGLLDHTIRGPYRINDDGLRVVKALNDVRPVITYDDEEWNDWKTWLECLGKERQYGSMKGYKMVTVEIPGSKEWESYFANKTW